MFYTIGVFIIFMLLSGFSGKLKVNILFSFILCLFLLIYFTLIKIPIGIILATILNLNLAWFIPYRFNRLKSSLLKVAFSKKNNYTLEYEKLQQKNADIEKSNKNLEGAITRITQLYEITKQMNKVLGLKENLDIFGKLLKENFDFNNCIVMLLKEKDSPLIKNAYRISKKEAGITRYSPIEATDKKLLNLVLSKGEPLYFDAQSQVFKELEISQDISSFVCVPLNSGDKIIGIIITTNLPKLELESFLIFTDQFTMELRKIELYEKIQEQALTDSLTGAYVRRHFLQRLDEELERSRRHNIKLAFIMIDIDHFKNKNDQYGHLVGDVVLKEVANLLKSNVREIDLIARYGGEEFCVALVNTDKKGAFNVAERIRVGIENKKIRAYDEQIRITISAGISCFPEDTDNKEKLIELADRAMYKAKQSGRNQTHVYKK